MTSSESEFDFSTDKRHPGTVLEISKAQFDYMLGVLPPRYGHGCFAMNEPANHTPEGEAIYHWAANRNNKYYICYGTKSLAEQAFAEMK